MNIMRTLAATTLAIGLVTVPAVAQKPQRMHRGGMMGQGFGQGGFNSQRMLERMAVVLELTDTQKQAAQKLMADAKAQAQPIAEQLRQNRQEMAAAVKANNTGNINNLATRQGNLVGQLSAIHAKAMADFYALLTPEQKQKAEALRSQRTDRMQQFRQKRQNQQQQQ